jgi:hypothetical protein
MLLISNQASKDVRRRRALASTHAAAYIYRITYALVVFQNMHACV